MDQIIASRTPREAEDAYEAASRLAAAGDLSVTALIGAAENLRALGAPARVQDLYLGWLRHNPRHPLAYTVRFNCAVALSDAGGLAEAHDQLRLALADQPAFAPAAINLGSVLERMGDRLAAIEAWRGLANRLAGVTGEAAGHRCTALNQMGRVLEAAHIPGPAEIALKTSLELDPAQHDVIQHLVALRQGQCEWPILEPLGKLSRRAQLAGASPLSLAGLIDDPVLQLANAHRYHARDAAPDGPFTAGAWPPPEDQTRRPLRIGYLSSDLREHAVGFLTADIFALHDRQRVEVFAYYCGIEREDALQARFRATADAWRPITALTDREAATLMVRDRIDILIDLNGYTKDGRIKLFNYRPAPCIVNWLGFPGSTGSPHHHYIIADPAIIPPQDEIFYSEKVLRLPCYQPTDPKRVVAETGQTRQEAGLPGEAFVFCVFNGAQKIPPELFAIWMEILRAVPGSVLWLLCTDEDIGARLRARAAEAGVDQARLIFAGRLENAQHMARYRLADLFLDTAPYGAHTTASDALWMGVPVLTVAGNGFAARVCASLVQAAGLPELVCTNWPAYRDLAIALAHDKQHLATLSARLRNGRAACTLFNTAGLVSALEDLYAQIWQSYCNGTLPVPRLDHLPAYHQIGADPDRPILPDRAKLLAWWQQQLSYRNAVQRLPADGLLWKEGSLLF